MMHLDIRAPNRSPFEAILPLRDEAVYGGSKAFVLSFAEALCNELDVHRRDFSPCGSLM